MRRKLETRKSFLAVLLLGALFAAPASPSGIAVTAASATVGAFGLEVTVGDTCSLPDNLSISAPPGPIEGAFEACLSVTADNVEVAGTGATFRAGEAIEFGDGFRVASNASFTAVLDPFLSTDFASVDDPSPIGETVYNATFMVRVDDLVLADGDSIEHLVGYSFLGQSEFVLSLRKNPSGQRALHLAARQDGGGMVQMTPGQELALAAGWNRIDLEWTAAAGDGALLVAVNQGPLTGLTGLTNASAQVETVRWGAIGGSVSTTTGTIELDGFDSWR